MGRFDYQAKDRNSGKIVKATLQASSENAAARLLTEQGLIPLNISPASEGANILEKLNSQVRNKDKIIFTRQLATLLLASIPLAQSLRTVLEQTQKRGMQLIVQDIIADIEGGRPLSEAFDKHSRIFDKFYIALVKAGEASGTLGEALERIANQGEKDAELMRKIRGAMIYPSIVLAVMLGVVIFMLVTIVPHIERLYADLNKTLPLLTQWMIYLANFLIHFWWLVIIAAGLGLYFLAVYKRTESGTRTFDLFKLNMPLFGSMFRRLYMSRFTHTGATLLASGVPMVEMLNISAESANNVIIADAIGRTTARVNNGKALSEALKVEEYILPLVPQMISIGEQSGQVDKMLEKVSQVYEEELDAEIRGLSTTIEPALMVILAVVAGGIIGAVLFPIYSLVSNIR